MCRYKLNTSVAALALWVAATATEASAQAQPPGASTLEEVVVTARRQEENQQTTPVSVTAVPAQELAARGVENVADVGRKVKLRVGIGETAVEAVEQRLRAWVLTIPGSR